MVFEVADRIIVLRLGRRVATFRQEETTPQEVVERDPRAHRQPERWRLDQEPRRSLEQPEESPSGTGLRACSRCRHRGSPGPRAAGRARRPAGHPRASSAIWILLRDPGPALPHRPQPLESRAPDRCHRHDRDRDRLRAPARGDRPLGGLGCRALLCHPRSDCRDAWSGRGGRASRSCSSQACSIGAFQGVWFASDRCSVVRRHARRHPRLARRAALRARLDRHDQRLRDAHRRDRDHVPAGRRGAGSSRSSPPSGTPSRTLSATRAAGGRVSPLDRLPWSSHRRWASLRSRSGIVAVLNSYKGVPTAGVIVLGLVVTFSWLTTRTRFGRYVYAVGGSVEAARRAGINVKAIRMTVFTLAGFFAAVGGLLAVSRNAAVRHPDGGRHAAPRGDRGRGDRRDEPLRWSWHGLVSSLRGARDRQRRRTAST